MERRPHTGGRKKRPAPAHLDPLQSFIAQYLDWIGAHGFSEDTIATRRAYLGYFHVWCTERGLETRLVPEDLEVTWEKLARAFRGEPA